MAQPDFEQLGPQLQEQLRQVFVDCGESCTRAYYPPERDENDHNASHALEVLEPHLVTAFRESLREAYRLDTLTRPVSVIIELDVEDGFEGYKAQIAVNVFKNLLDSLFAPSPETTE